MKYFILIILSVFSICFSQTNVLIGNKKFKIRGEEVFKGREKVDVGIYDSIFNYVLVKKDSVIFSSFKKYESTYKSVQITGVKIINLDLDSIDGGPEVTELVLKHQEVTYWQLSIPTKLYANLVTYSLFTSNGYTYKNTESFMDIKCSSKNITESILNKILSIK